MTMLEAPDALSRNAVRAGSPAIRLADVSKVYRLYGTPREQILDSMGFTRFLPKSRRPNVREFHALKHVSLTIGKGERVGIIGRNGAGKTTLLRLITGNFAPTTGAVEVNGSVQALMQLGLGFHPEFSGYENIRSALNYNGLTGKEFDAALADVVDFVELGDFLYQPLKTYSMGMNARLQFAAATAIHPDIMIVDEVLGAGDAYFAAKCAFRMKKLTSREGATLLLVSHSATQILQFCSRGIWLEAGEVIMDGPAIDVIGAYEVESERRIHAAKVAADALEQKIYESSRPLPDVSPPVAARAEPSAEAKDGGGGASPAHGERPSEQDVPVGRLPPEVQDPPPPPELPTYAVKNWLGSAIASKDVDREDGQLDEYRVELENGLLVHRWPSNPGVKIRNLQLMSLGQPTTALYTQRPCTIDMKLEVEVDHELKCRYFFSVFNLEALRLAWITSPIDTFRARPGDTRLVRVKLNPLLLGGGTFILSTSIFDDVDLLHLSAAHRYDLLARCLEFKVIEHDGRESPVFHHPAGWEFETVQTTAER